MPTARNGNVELNYEVSGDGPPLLLIQGLGYGIWGWFRQMPDLEDDFTVIAFDNRGVGGSTKVTDPYTVEDMAADAVAVLDDAGVDRANVLGVSLGGVVAQVLAANHPDRVERLVLLATTHGGPKAVPIPEETAALMADPGEGLTDEERIRKVMPPAFRPGWTEEHEEEFDRIVRRRLRHVPPWDAYAAQAAAGAQADTTKLLGKIEAPTLILHGKADRVVPPENAELLTEKIPEAELRMHPRAGHLAMIEEPEWVNGHVREFCWG